jgi:predicted DNA-binding protein
MLIDTSGLLCLHYPTELLHSLACTAYKRATVKLTHIQEAIELYLEPVENEFSE